MLAGYIHQMKLMFLDSVCTGSRGLDAALQWPALIFPCVRPLLSCAAFFLDFILDCVIHFQCYYLPLLCILFLLLFCYACLFFFSRLTFMFVLSKKVQYKIKYEMNAFIFNFRLHFFNKLRKILKYIYFLNI